MTLWKSLQDRGVPRNLVLYVGAAWGLVQCADFFVTRYRLTDTLVDLLLIGLLALLPLAMWIGWRLGGPDEAGGMGRRQLAIGAAYLLLVAVALGWGFAGRDLGRAIVEVNTVDAEGIAIVAERPRADLVRAVSVMPFTADAKAAPWLGMAVADTLQTDLSQHRFLSVLMPWSAALRKAYGDRQARLPLRLMAQEASRNGAAFLVAGEVSGTLERMSVRAEVHRVQPLKLLHSIEIRDKPLFALVDVLSVEVKSHLALDAERADGDDDVPVAELLSSKPDALAAFFEADYALVVHEDYTAAYAASQRALALDPDFAMAAMRLTTIAQATGHYEVARAAIGNAMANQHQFTEAQRCLLRMLQASYAGQTERTLRIGKGCVDMFPHNVTVREIYGGVLSVDPATVDEAIAQYEAIYHLGTANDSALLQIARLKSMSGNAEGAIDALQRYRAAHPEETATAMQMSELLIRKGDLAAAENILLDALGREETAGLTAALANLFVRLGRFDEANALLDAFQPTSAGDTIALAAARSSALISRGRERAALAIYDAAIAQAPPGLVSQYQLSRLIQFGSTLVRTLGIEGIDAELDKLLADRDEISRNSREVYRAIAALNTRDTALLAQSAQALEAFITRTRRGDLQHVLSLVQARQLDAEGKGKAAAQRFAEGHAQMLASPTRLGIGEALVLRWWLASEASGAGADDVAPAAERLRRSFPGNPAALVALAEHAWRQGDAEEARTLLDRALPALEGADEDAPIAITARRLDEQLAQ